MGAPEVRTVRSSDGRALCFAEWGASEGAAVFWEHGTPGSRLIPSTLVEAGVVDLLNSLGVRVITYDRPGYGRSERRQGRRVADSASDVATIADALGLGRFAIGGGSSGSAHALASAAVLGERVARAACVAPMAPCDQLGAEEWSKGQDEALLDYVGRCLEGEKSLTAEVARSVARMREQAPGDSSVEEASRSGIWGWVDDELALFGPWGFDVADVTVPVSIYYDPDETILPRQHGEWLARNIPQAQLVEAPALGHRRQGDAMAELHRVYAWLVES